VTDRNVAHRRPQLLDALAREPVIDAGSIPTGADQPRPRQHLQVLRGVGNALRDLACNLLDRALPLRQQIDDLRPPAATERLRNRGERIEQRRFRSTAPHLVKLSLEYLRSNSSII